MSKQRTEGLQNAIRLLHNKKVREYFKDIDDGDTSNTPRASTRRLLLLQDNDSLIYQIQAMQFFKDYCLDEFGYSDRYYSVPISTYNIYMTHLPQITLYFKQIFNSNASEETKYRAQTLQVSFRVRDIKIPANNSALRLIATDIKNIFGTPLYQYRSGYRRISYFNKPLGYHFTIRCRDIIDGENLIKDCLRIFNDVDEYDARDLKISESKLGSAITTQTTRKTRVLGRNLNQPKREESIRFRFDRADYKQYPAKPITIVRKSDVLI